MSNSSEEKQYDVVVIGAGPAGYVCAIRCAQLGMRTACVDSWADAKGKPSLGGTCLNVGCIPSKALLDSSHHFAFMQNESTSHGIQVENLSLNVGAMQKRRQKIIKTLTTGIKGLFKKNGVDSYYGQGVVEQAGQVRVDVGDGDDILLSTKTVVIATGSKPTAFPNVEIDQERILDSTGVLELDEVPEQLGIIGAGVIGLEMGSVWSRQGSDVTVIEAMPDFLPTADRDIARKALKLLSSQGLSINLATKVMSIERVDDHVEVLIEDKEGQRSLQFDRLLIAIGRAPSTEGLRLDAIGVETDARGFIGVDSNWKTNVDGIYAIGDVIGGAMLAHKGSEEGVALAEQLAGQAGHMDYDNIPWVIYTWPEVAWAGKTETQLKEQGRAYNVGEFPFMALGRARAMGDQAGKIKLIGDAETDQLLGAHIIGPNASELIAEVVVAMEAELSTEDLARTIHAHPTLSEGMHEAALAVHKRPIHI